MPTTPAPGLITWMHTFSPAKMWIAGLSELRKPLLHLHTQFNRDIPWDSIDMDFMNLNQAAHGDREYGFIGTRMGMARKVVVGYWEDPEVRRDIGRLGARRRRLRRRPEPESRPLRRQHARGRRHRGRQSRSADPARAGRSTATASAIWSARVNGFSDAEVDALMDEYAETVRLRARCPRRRPGPRPGAGAGADRTGPAGLSDRRRLRRLHDDV